MLDAEDSIETHLERVLVSERFSRSKRNSDLLSYLVRETSQGRAESITGTSVAQDVFEKGSDFDPATDPSIRVQMGRLRRMLDDYYAEEGAREPLRIGIPKASYIPVLTPTSQPVDVPEGAGASDVPDRATTSRAATDRAATDRTASKGEPAVPRGWETLGGTILSILRRYPVPIGAAALAFSLLVVLAIYRGDEAALALPTEIARNYPTIHVQPFANNTGDSANDILEVGLQREVAADLERFRVARVALDGVPAVEGRERMEPDFILAGTVLSTDPELDMIVQLIATEDSAVVESERLTMQTEGDYFDTLETLSRKISSDFGGPRGRLTRSIWSNLDEVSDDAIMEGDLAAFRCLARFHAFEAARTVEEFGTVRDCLALHSGRNPEDGTLLSALAWTLLVGSEEAGLLDVSAIAPPHHDPRYALKLAERAVAIDPANDDAHEYLGLIEWFNGYHDRALASLRRALKLNPANARHRANYALFSTLAGDPKRGVELMYDAIAWHIDPPAWYRTAFLHDALMAGDGSRAIEVLDEGAAKGDPFEPVYRLTAASLADDTPEIERLLPLVRDHAKERGGDPLDGVRIWLADTQVLATMTQELKRRGVPVPDVQRASMASAFPDMGDDT